VRGLPEGTLDFLIRHEGEVLDAYHDPVGFPTQGVGHLLSRKAWAPLGQWPRITQEQSRAWLAQDVMLAQAAILRQVVVPLSNEQLLALNSFVFNLGAGALEMSTLLRMLNRGDYEGAADQFPRWVYAGRVRLPGLVRRRHEEREIFLS
jgi:lysozyme